MVNPTDHIGLVYNILNSYVPRSHPLYEDLFQEGFLGLLVAIPKFDPAREVPFHAYAAYWIRAYILLHLRKYTPTPYDTSKAIEIASTLPSPEEVAIRMEELHIFTPVLDSFVEKADDRERYILQNRSLADEPSSLEEIALHWGVSRQRVDQIEKRLLNKLRNAIQLDRRLI